MISLSLKNSNINNEINDKIYQRLINKINLECVKCTCGHCCFVKNGRYKRIIKINDRKIYINIQRVICRSCGKTHAILTSNMIPYMHISMEEALDIINTIDEYTVDSSDYEAVDILKRYKIWKDKLIAMRTTLKENIDTLLSLCSSFFHMCFLQRSRRKYCNNGKIYEVEYLYLGLST